MASQGKPWLQFIIDDQGRSYRKEMGLIVAKSSRKPLRYSAQGWQEISIAWERDLERWGVNRNFSLPLGFVLDGADIMRFLMYKGNFEKKVYLLIQKQYLFIDPTNYYFYYDLFYKGQIDLTTAVDEEDKVSVNINEGGILQDLKANEGTEYEIACDEITIRMDGISLDESGELQVLDIEVGATTALSTHYVPMTFLGSEGSLPGLLFTSQSVGGFSQSQQYFVRNVNTTSITIKLTGTVVWHVNDRATGTIIRLHQIDVAGNPTTLRSETHSPSTPDLDYTFTLNETITLPAGYKLAITVVMQAVPAQLAATRATYKQTSIFIGYTFRSEPTFVKALFPLTLFKRLAAKMTGSEDNAISAILQTFKHFAITSGDAIRGIPGAVIKIKFADFDKSIHAVLSTSLQVKNKKIYIESIADALQDTNPIALGQVKEIKTEMAKELLVNTIKIGSPEQTYDDVNGKQEFNNTSIYSSDIKKAVKELDLTSTIRRDCYGAEFARINLDGKRTTDASSDNDVWFLDIDVLNPASDAEHGVYYNLFRDTYDVITGLLTPASVFNVRLSTARMFARHKPYINSLFYGFEGTKLAFQTTDKNRELYTKKGTEIFDEDADYIVDGVGRLFKPFTFDIKPETPIRLAETLEADPNRCFSFEHYNGEVYTGFNLNVGLAVNTMEETAFLLLSSNQNDLTLLTNQ